jgi:opacity protein-like surface antigen
MKPIVLLLALAICVPVSGEAATQSKTSTKTQTQTQSKTTKSKTRSKSHSSTGFGLKAIGGALGFVSPEGIDGTFSIGAFANLGTITPDIALETRLDYWSKSEESFGAKASVGDINFGVRGKYLFETSNPKVTPFAGAGLGLHHISAKATTPAVPGFPSMTVEDSQTKLGLDFGGGITTRLSPRADFLAEAWYSIVSDVNQFSLRVGVSQRLGSH